ncbi:rhythmically expressed gene 2 protein [Drosophila grimshawi]|uniref:GH16592 n=1 Tax=Drosophila grimshawi TaxID=7222 RepID=B4J258_DROGR|nr:rhythmically expressed gene 2 protein [Drosophila grimshawi]EDV97009.1 GH16592 [Drosophila grimshawi]
MRSLKRFRLITFDLTNTLLQFRTSPGKHYGEVGALFGARCDNDELAKNYKANWYKLNRDYPNFGCESQPRLEWQRWWRQLIAGTFADSGAPIPDEKLDNFTNHLLELYKSSICWQPCNGSVELLKQLRKHSQAEKDQCKVGMIANFDPRLEALLHNTKLDRYLDFALTSYEAKVEKPQAAIFERAMLEAGLANLKPQECLHVGDGPTTDYLGAQDAGWHAALVHEKSYSYLVKKYGGKINKNHVFASLYDFHRKLLDDAVVW